MLPTVLFQGLCRPRVRNHASRYPLQETFEIPLPRAHFVHLPPLASPLFPSLSSPPRPHFLHLHLLSWENAFQPFFPLCRPKRLLLSTHNQLQVSLLTSMLYITIHDLFPASLMSCSNSFDLAYTLHTLNVTYITVSTCFFPTFAHLAHKSSGLFRNLCSHFPHGKIPAIVCSHLLRRFHGTASFAIHFPGITSLLSPSLNRNSASHVVVAGKSSCSLLILSPH